MRRFWSSAEAVAQAGSFVVRLDGKPVNLPGGGVLIVEGRALAGAIATEWQDAGQIFTPDDLPLTRLAATARERVPAGRDEIIGQLAGYGMNDLLCYRAADQPALAADEDAAWTPWLAWAMKRFDVTLLIGDGITPIVQPPEIRVAFTTALRALSDSDLAGLGVIVPALGSLILGLAVAAGELAADLAWVLAELDALWQAARWGEDEEAAARRRAGAEDVAVATRFMILCRS